MFANVVRVVVEGRAKWVLTCCVRNYVVIVFKRINSV